MAYKTHIIQPREPSQRTFTAVRESLPHACFYRSSDTAFEAKLYPKQDVVVKVATPGRPGYDDFYLEVAITSSADPFLSEIYPKHDITRPNPRRFGSEIPGSWGCSFTCEAPDQLVKLVGEIVSLKLRAIEISSRHVPDRSFEEVYHVNTSRPNPDYDAAWHEYGYARHRKGWVAHSPDEEGIPRMLTTSQRRTRIEIVKGTDTIGQINRLGNYEDLFEQLR